MTVIYSNLAQEDLYRKSCLSLIRSQYYKAVNCSDILLLYAFWFMSDELVIADDILHTIDYLPHSNGIFASHTPLTTSSTQGATAAAKSRNNKQSSRFICLITCAAALSNTGAVKWVLLNTDHAQGKYAWPLVNKHVRVEEICQENAIPEAK